MQPEQTVSGEVALILERVDLNDAEVRWPFQAKLYFGLSARSFLCLIFPLFGS